MTEESKPVRCGCGGEAKIIHGDYRTSVYCTNCGIQTCYYATETEAVTAWNGAMSGVAETATTERTAKVVKIELSRNPRNLVYKCKNCGQYTHRTAWSRPVQYCNSCGAKLDWSEDE